MRWKKTTAQNVDVQDYVGGGSSDDEGSKLGLGISEEIRVEISPILSYWAR